MWPRCEKSLKPDCGRIVARTNPELAICRRSMESDLSCGAKWARCWRARSVMLALLAKLRLERREQPEAKWRMPSSPKTQLSRTTDSSRRQWTEKWKRMGSRGNVERVRRSDRSCGQRDERAVNPSAAKKGRIKSRKFYHVKNRV